MTKPKIEPAEQTAVIYGRVSSEDPVQGFSLQAQLRACREWAEKNGFKVLRQYVEEGHSAFRNLDKREVFKELLSQLPRNTPSA
jgi:site-specific DNA recombinase